MLNKNGKSPEQPVSRDAEVAEAERAAPLTASINKTVDAQPQAKFDHISGAIG